MGLLSSLFASVSGINSSGTAISVIGDNIANSNTTGYKSSRAEFVDVLSGSLGGVAGAGQVGAGSRVSGTNQTFLQGSLESTGLVTDLAVDGRGFFIVQDPQGVFYSRAGLFRLDANQVIVNPQGQTVLGFGITPSGAPNGAPGPISLSNVSSAPNPTTRVEVNVNLDPDDDVISLPFDHADPVATSNFQTGLQTIDSLGNPHNVLLYFRKETAVNSWSWYSGVRRGDLDFTAYGAPFTAIDPTDEPDQFVPIQSGTLTFDSFGNLDLEDTTALTINYDVDGDGVPETAAATPGNAAGWSFGSGAAPGQLLNFDYGTSLTEGGTGNERTTQYGGTGSNNFIRFAQQDGYEEGSLQGIEVDENGFVTGLFSNGQTQRLAQVALATFANINGLQRVGKSNWVETTASGNPIIGSPGQAGFGAIRSGFLEQSNTDLAEEFVKLILSQRAFQANTRTISTTNELLANLVNLGQ